MNGNYQYVAFAGFGNAIPTNEITIEFWERGYTADESTIGFDPDQSTNRLNAYMPYLDGLVYWDFGNINTGGQIVLSASHFHPE